MIRHTPARRTIATLGALGLVIVAALSCVNVPVKDVSKSFAVEVREITEKAEAIKLDFLWIIDNSPSMCQEQTALARSFKEFTDYLTTYLSNLDIRLAVVTTNANDKNAGKFVNKPATNFPPACYEQRVWPCLGDSDCIKKFGQGWQCKPPTGAASQMYNMNGSVNSACEYRCVDHTDCCEEFCGPEECGKDLACITKLCKTAPSDDCTFECRKPGGGTGNSGCLEPPATKDCPNSIPKILTMNANGSNLEWFKCIATVEPEQNYNANMEQGLKAAWMALDPNGPNAEQAQGFMRDDAYLVIVFISDEDDCSIAEDFSAPNSPCTKDDDCSPKPWSKCRVDAYYSSLLNKETKLCTNSIKKDYYNVCSLLGEFKGKPHHYAAYDGKRSDCVSDEDCEAGWSCKAISNTVKKCRPNIYNLTNIATYQSPPGTPLFALSSVADYYSRFRTLKKDPAKVLIAAITGDGVPSKSEKDSLLSTKCLDNDKLTACKTYKTVRASAEKACLDDPERPECKEYYQSMIECIRMCYFASKGDSQNPQVAKNSYVCESEFGKADFGSRYVRLANMFGPNGMVSNMCSETGIAPALQTIAELIVKRVTKVCLPLPSKDGEAIVVNMLTKKPDGTYDSVRLEEGEDGEGDYKFEFPTQDCCDPDTSGNCQGTLKAITFNRVLDPNVQIEVKYEAKLTDDDEE